MLQLCQHFSKTCVGREPLLPIPSGGSPLQNPPPLSSFGAAARRVARATLRQDGGGRQSAAMRTGYRSVPCAPLRASERLRLPTPQGRVAHAELEIGNSLIMLADECPERGAQSPPSIGGTPVSFHVYVRDVDAVYAKAIAAGAKSIRPVTNQFYGDRTGLFVDPFGHQWNVATHVEDVSPEELQKRMAAMSQ